MASYSYFWGGEDAYALQNNRPGGNRDVQRVFRRINERKNRTLMLQLLGEAAGAGTATNSRSRITAVAGAPGGVQTIESQSIINRTTTAADLTAMEAIVNTDSAPSSYPTDKAGIGGGGKVGF